MILGQTYQRWLFFAVAVAVLTVLRGLIWGWEGAWVIPAVATVSAVAHLVYDVTGIGARIPEGVKRAYEVVGLAAFVAFVVLLVGTYVFGWW